MASARCFKVHSADNVATLLDDAVLLQEAALLTDAASSSVSVLGQGQGTIELKDSIKLGHKIALAAIAEGAAIIKFGVPIGHAKAPIRQGEWVHLHNCESRFDERSQTLDVNTGAVTDTKYE